MEANAQQASAKIAARVSSRWAERWRAFLRPLESGRRMFLDHRWNELPSELQTPNQISGRHLTHCSFTTGASYCSFHCTHCYLPPHANEVPIPSLAEMKDQIDANLRFQGPGGGLQITGGDMADAYWRAGRADELVEIVRHAHSVGLVPMLFTHGQTFLEHPAFLERLVVEAGLRQVAVHIDVTQAGRHGFPIQRMTSEADLHPVREAFTALATQIRAKTGAKLEFAHNCTVTRRNIDDLPDLVKWFLANPERSQIWRTLSFQPKADTGRTIFSRQPVTPALVWEKLQQGVGQPLRRDAAIFGHPDCNSWAPILVSDVTGDFFPILPDHPCWDTLFGKILKSIGGLSLVNDDADTPFFRVAGIIARNPWLVVRFAHYFADGLARGRMRLGVLASLLSGRAHVVNLGIHNFMGAAQVAAAESDPVTRARLDACVFKGAVKENGEWKAVSMCRMNQQKWSEVYAARSANPELAGQTQPWDRADLKIPAEESRTPASQFSKTMAE